MDEFSPLLVKLTSEIRPKNYPKGQVIFYGGDEVLDVAILQSGFVKIYDIDDQGNEKLLHILRRGAVLPFAFFSGGDQITNWFYAALTDCELSVLDKQSLWDQARADNQLLIYLVNWFSLEVHELLVRLSSLGKSNARQKIRAALQFLAVKNAQQHHGEWRRVCFPVNHQLIADMTGVTRESAAMIMKDLVNKGLVRNPRQTILEIHEKILR